MGRLVSVSASASLHLPRHQKVIISAAHPVWDIWVPAPGTTKPTDHGSYSGENGTGVLIGQRNITEEKGRAIRKKGFVGGGGCEMYIRTGSLIRDLAQGLRRIGKPFLVDLLLPFACLDHQTSTTNTFLRRPLSS